MVGMEYVKDKKKNISCTLFTHSFRFNVGFFFYFSLPFANEINDDVELNDLKSIVTHSSPCTVNHLPFHIRWFDVVFYFIMKIIIFIDHTSSSAPPPIYFMFRWADESFRMVEYEEKKNTKNENCK